MRTRAHYSISLRRVKAFPRTSGHQRQPGTASCLKRGAFPRASVPHLTREGQEGITGLWKSPRNRRTGRCKSPTCHTRRGDGTWGPPSRVAQAGSRGLSGPAFVLSACTLPEVNDAFFTFAEGDFFAFSSLLFGRGRGAKVRGRDVRREPVRRGRGSSLRGGAPCACPPQPSLRHIAVDRDCGRR